MGLHDLELDLAVKKVGGAPWKSFAFHNPDEENGYLSNWYLRIQRIQYHLFLNGAIYDVSKSHVLLWPNYCKKDFNHSWCCSSKKFGRQVSNYNENRWNGIRQIVVYEGLLAKFSQNLNLKDLLKATGDNLLAECAVKDKIWGVGLSMSDPDRLDITKWKGQNLLGYSLMMVREKIWK